MLLKVLLIIFLAIVSTLSEAPLASQSAPYPAAGWRPNPPFNLPGDEEYLPPRREFDEPQKQAPQLQPVNIEISKERVDFAGQIQGNSFFSTNQPQNAYFPPENTKEEPDFISLQGLPNRNKPQQFFKKQQPQQQRKKQQFFRRQPSPPQQQQPQQQQKFGQRLPSKEAPKDFKPPLQQQQQQQQQFFPDNQQLPMAEPAQEYGTPNNNNEGQFNIIYPDLEPEPRSLQPQKQSDEDERLTIEALKVAVDAYNRNMPEESQSSADINASAVNDEQSNAGGYPYSATPELGRLTQGQYYILGPDNSLQRVKFTTSQNEEESRIKGFTAQLKYTPVGEISDPVFKYNNRGQLVRIFKK